jgi:hypothetical protein
MKEVSISSLGELKTVFNSPDENVHFYGILNSSFNTNSLGVQLAKPILRNNVHQILWKAEVNVELKSLSTANDSERKNIGKKIKIAFEEFEEKSKTFRNFPPNFIDKIKEIPNFSSILFGITPSNEHQIIITNWGFLEDKIDRASGILQSIFPPASHSILVKAISEGGVPQEGKKIYLQSENSNTSDITDKRGYARLGDVVRGETFQLQNDKGKKLAEDCIADGRSEYIIEFNRDVQLRFKIVCKNNSLPLSFRTVKFKSPFIGEIDNSTDSEGVFTLNHPDSKGEFHIIVNGKNVFSSIIPVIDSEFKIEVECEENNFAPIDVAPIEEPLEEEPEFEDVTTNLKFTKFFKRPIKNLAFSLHKKVKDGQPNKLIDLSTDNKGESSTFLDEGEYLVKFHRYGIPWSYEFIHSNDINIHHFRPRAIFPWLWWLLNAFLLFLLLCCLLDCEYCKICNAPIKNHNEIVEAKEELPVFGLEWDLELNNPCADDSWIISNNNTQLIFKIEDSENCGGHCKDVQKGSATANITIGEQDVYLNLDFEGIGELFNEDYEIIEFLLDGVKIADAHAAGGNKKCEFGPVIKKYYFEGPYKLEKGTKHAIRVNFTTNDHLYHIGCYYQVNLEFNI